MRSSTGSADRAWPRALAAGVLTLGAWMVLVAQPARADCSPLDLSCVTDTVTDTVQDTTDTVTGTVQDVTQTVSDTTGQVVDTVVGTVTGAVDTVVDTADQTLGGTGDGGTSSNGRSGGADPSGTSTAPTNDDAAGIPAREAAAGVVASEGTPSEVAGARITAPSPGGTAVSTESASTTSALERDAGRDAEDATELSPSGPRKPTAIATIAAIAFPFALLLLVGAFLFAQHRVDRRAPKLALAPLAPDVAAFS